MKAPSRRRLRLSVRLALLVFSVEALLLGVFAVMVFQYCEKVFYRSFDLALRANAEALASLIEEDEEEEAGLELEFADEIMQRFSRKQRPDLFAVLLPGGRVLEKSVSLDPVPDVTLSPGETAHFENFQHRGRGYRGVVLSVRGGIDDHHAPRGPLRVFFAAHTHDIEEQLRDIAQFLAWFFGAGLALSALLAGIVVWRGLSPLRNLTRETRRMREDRLSERLPVDNLPADLLPLVEAINGFLERLEGAFERERRFSSDAAHELRTPVATLKSGLQAALLTSTDRGEPHPVLHELLEEVIRLENLCDSLLVVASRQVKQESAGMAAREWCNVIEDVVERLKPSAHGRESTLEFQEPDAMPGNTKVQAEPDATQRIASNLIDNAIRHGGRGTRIRVACSLTPSEARLVVEDNGPGVSPEHVPRLFERFFRADQARSRATGGTGLGLAICQSLATSTGGEVRYEPVSPQGSRFVWQIKRQPHEPSDSAENA